VKSHSVDEQNIVFFQLKVYYKNIEGKSDEKQKRYVRPIVTVVTGVAAGRTAWRDHGPEPGIWRADDLQAGGVGPDAGAHRALSG
jgi:hypothetical protein